MQHKQKPVREIRLGRIRAAIWANHSNGGMWFNVTVTRLFRNGNQWQETHSFGRDDLPVVAKVADMAYAWIWEQEAPVDPSGAPSERLVRPSFGQE